MGQLTDNTRETFTVGRRGRPVLVTLAFQAKQTQTAVFAVIWCSVTRQLLRRTLGKPPVPLSGILYEQGQSQQNQDLQCEATVKGTSGLVSHRLTKLQALRNRLAQQASQTSFFIYIAVSPTQHLRC